MSLRASPEPTLGSKEIARRRLLLIFGVALLLRLAVMAFLFPQQLDPARDHWAFGYETGRIARSIAEGRGFSSPLFTATGPTTWMTPVYPCVLAGIFQIFGIYSKAACLAILSFNSLISALTCIPIFLFTRRNFGGRAAEWAAWIWALFPYSVYWPVERIWDTWLATLLLAFCFWRALRLAESNSVRDWIVYGALSGLAAMTDPAVLAPLPFLALWALWGLHKSRKPWLAPAIACVLAVILVSSPWFIRNAIVFHKFIPFRDDFSLALHVGNNSANTADVLALDAGPWKNSAEWSKYQKEGEIAYMEGKNRITRDYIESHPLRYAENCARRFVYLWTSFWNFDSEYLLGFPLLPAGIFLDTGLTILALMGLWFAFRVKSAAEVWPYALVLILFPLVYYITSLEPWYRVPMEPVMAGLAGGALVALRERRKTSEEKVLPAPTAQSEAAMHLN